MVWLLVLGFPPLLLLFMLFMQKVEEPLREVSAEERLEDLLDAARPDEVEAFVSEGFSNALERYWRRRRLAGLLSMWSRFPASSRPSPSASSVATSSTSPSSPSPSTPSSHRSS